MTARSPLQVHGFGLGFRIQGLGFRIQGLGFRIQGSGFGGRNGKPSSPSSYGVSHSGHIRTDGDKGIQG